MTHFLTGKKAICNFVGRSWTTVEDWIINRGFPAQFLGGRWESDSDLITKWRRKLINGPNKKEKAIKSDRKTIKKQHKKTNIN